MVYSSPHNKIVLPIRRDDKEGQSDAAYRRVSTRIIVIDPANRFEWKKKPNFPQTWTKQTRFFLETEWLNAYTYTSKTKTISRQRDQIFLTRPVPFFYRMSHGIASSRPVAFSYPLLLLVLFLFILCKIQHDIRAMFLYYCPGDYLNVYKNYFDCCIFISFKLIFLSIF